MKRINVILFYRTKFKEGTPDQTRKVVYTVFSRFPGGAFLKLTLQKRRSISTGETWSAHVSNAPYALSVKALYKGLSEKTQCCKNTVNSTAEPGWRKKKKDWSAPLAGACSYWVTRWRSRLQRWPLVTFVLKAALLKRAEGGGAGGGCFFVFFLQRSMLVEFRRMKKLTKIAHSHARPTQTVSFEWKLVFTFVIQLWWKTDPFQKSSNYKLFSAFIYYFLSILCWDAHLKTQETLSRDGNWNSFA